MRPLIRGAGETSWEDAYARIAEGLAVVKAQYGARSLAVYTGWPFVEQSAEHGR